MDDLRCPLFINLGLNFKNFYNQAQKIKGRCPLNILQEIIIRWFLGESAIRNEFCLRVSLKNRSDNFRCSTLKTKQSLWENKHCFLFNKMNHMFDRLNYEVLIISAVFVMLHQKIPAFIFFLMFILMVIL